MNIIDESIIIIITDFLNDLESIDLLIMTKMHKTKYYKIKNYISIHMMDGLISSKFKIQRISDVANILELNHKKLIHPLTHLTFGGSFNQKIENLPELLTHLTFGYYFNQKIENLPESLTHLIFDVFFNQKIENLPKSLIQLTLSNLYRLRQDIPLTIQNNIKICII